MRLSTLSLSAKRATSTNRVACRIILRVRLDSRQLDVLEREGDFHQDRFRTDDNEFRGESGSGLEGELDRLDVDEPIVADVRDAAAGDGEGFACRVERFHP